MITTKQLNKIYWKMFDNGIVEDDCKPDTPQIEIEEIDTVGRIYHHRFEVRDVTDAREKIQWMLDNSECYEVVFFNPGQNPVTWRNPINDREWTYYYGR